MPCVVKNAEGRMHSGKWSGEELSAGDVDVGMSKGMEGGHQAQMGLKLGLEAARGGPSTPHRLGRQEEEEAKE